ncbi:hypothetical protein FACS1894125_0480 [Actinomycetota bacterium]|nr:hypothetical protein FACS1894125_0480 [Actinomycetota bacterium]
MKIGIFGGTFNPPHQGHFAAAKQAALILGLDILFFTPANIPAFKGMISSGESRIEKLTVSAKQYLSSMTEAPNDGSTVQQLNTFPAFIAGSTKKADTIFAISDVDIKRGGITYSIDTVQDFAKLYPTAQLYFIAGADVLPDLDKWKYVDTLLEECRFVVVSRPGHKLEVPPKFAGRVTTLEINTPDVSSTQLRRATM